MEKKSDQLSLILFVLGGSGVNFLDRILPNSQNMLLELGAQGNQPFADSTEEAKGACQV
jgi:hypothetical protein